MRSSIIGLACVVAVASATSCTGDDHGESHDKGRVRGHVYLIGGPPGSATSGPHLGTGRVLVYSSSSRTGRAVAEARIVRGRYTLTLAPGRYYLATTAAKFNDTAAEGPSVSVRADTTVRADIDVQIK